MEGFVHTGDEVSLRYPVHGAGRPVSGELCSTAAERRDVRTVSGHDISLARNNWLQVADAVRWSDTYVGQADHRRDNDGLRHNCG
jgi:hypothetical protein